MSASTITFPPMEIVRWTDVAGEQHEAFVREWCAVGSDYTWRDYVVDGLVVRSLVALTGTASFFDPMYFLLDPPIEG